VPSACRCHGGLPYEDCCLPFHLGAAPAPTAERLMRSRYCAFAMQNENYLRRTWDPSTCPVSIDLDLRTRWHHLQILSRTGGGLFDRVGTVEFLAGYSPAGRDGEHRETSRFVRKDRRWLYLGPT
jgi:SEC-C motif-containing protein